jgi:lanthanide-dependent methanol dehydrogenase
MQCLSFRRFCLIAAAAALLCSPGCKGVKTAEELSPAVPRGSYVAQPYGGKFAPDDGQWVRPAKDFASTRFSSLDQINTQNVGSLKVAWTFNLGTDRGVESAPLVVKDTMYIVTPWPNLLYAIDLSRPGGPLKWKYDPRPAAASKGEACCDLVNRGAVFDDGKIFYNTLDGYTVAVNATTGQQVWKTQLADINLGETITMAPLVAKGKVFVGDSGGEFGIHGWLTAVDENSGKIAWRAYNTGPDSAVLIGARFKPFYPQYKGQDLGVKTWPPDAWKVGGAGVWGWISYDPDLNLIYYGTANPGPWNADDRPGDNLWSSGVWARDPDTGQAVWFYQATPHDLHDYDGINESILLDLPVNGQTRKVMVRPERNGYLYVIDRTNGEVLSATPFGYINSTSGVDLKSGQLKYIEEKHPRVGSVVRNICPAAPGTKDWQPAAFSPKTGLLYIPHQNLCMDVEETEANYIAGTPYVGMNVRMYAGPGGQMGQFTAWDPVNAKAVWELKDKFPFWSGAMVTAGNVVFFGTMDGWFKAVDAVSGKELWAFKTGSGIVSQPITYKGPDGKQYVAVLSGVGGWAGAIVSGGLDARDGTAALGFANAMKELPQNTVKGGVLYVFTLP